MEFLYYHDFRASLVIGSLFSCLFSPAHLLQGSTGVFPHSFHYVHLPCPLFDTIFVSFLFFQLFKPGPKFRLSCFFFTQILRERKRGGEKWGEKCRERINGGYWSFLKGRPHLIWTSQPIHMNNFTSYPKSFLSYDFLIYPLIFFPILAGKGSERLSSSKRQMWTLQRNMFGRSIDKTWVWSIRSMTFPRKGAKEWEEKEPREWDSKSRSGRARWMSQSTCNMAHFGNSPCIT